MKKNLLRTFSLFLIAICLFSAVSCAQEENDTFDLDLMSEETVIDFGGDELVYMANTRDERVEINPWEETEDSSWTELLKERYKETEKKYNIKIRIETDDGMLVQNYCAGLDWADIYEQHVGNIRSYLYADMLIPLNTIDGFLENIEDGMWGEENVLNYMKRGENYYAFQAAFHGVPFRHIGSVLYANKTVLSKYGFDVLEMIEDGKWTWSEFENILATIGNDYRNSDAEIGYLISKSFPHYACYAAATSNGCEIVKTDSDGNLISNLSDEKFIEAVEWINHLITDGLATYGENSGYLKGSAASYQFPRFTENKCAFWCEYSYVGTVDPTGFMFNNVDFLITPFPCGPSGEYGKWAGNIIGAEHYFAIPVTADTDIVSAVLCDIYQPLGDDKYSWKEHFARQNFLYTESAELYYTMLDNAIPVYEEAVGTFPFGSVLSGSKSIQEALESSESEIQALLDDYFNKYNK